MNKPTIKMWIARLGRLGAFIEAIFGLTFAVIAFIVLSTVKVLSAIWAKIVYFYLYHFDFGSFLGLTFIVAVLTFLPFLAYMSYHLNKVVPVTELQLHIDRSACVKTHIHNHLADRKAAPIIYDTFYRIREQCEDTDAITKQREAIK